VSEIETNPEKTAMYTVRMGGTQWSVATFGIVEFLRSHRPYRVLVAVLGVTSGLAYIASWAGLKIPGVGSYFVMLIAASWLLWLATVSGPQFQLIFPAEKATQERQVAEERFDESRTAEDALRLDLKRLNEYCVINQAQARSSFRWAIFSMLLGFGTIIAGIWFFYFRRNQPDQFMVGVSTAAGVVVNLISGLFLYMHSKTQDRSLHYYEQLSRLQRLSLARMLVDAHSDPDKQAEARNLVIRELLIDSRPATLDRTDTLQSTGRTSG